MVGVLEADDQRGNGGCRDEVKADSEVPDFRMEMSSW